MDSPSSTSSLASCFGAQKDVLYMDAALAQARKAYALDEVPVGAVVVDARGIIIARAYNQTERQGTQLAHAECLALAKAGKKKEDWRLEGCWVFVTLEPCAMCMQALVLSRVEGVVFGARSPLFGYHLDNNTSVWIYQKHVMRIVPGVRAQEAATLMKQFFKPKRTKGVSC